MYCNFFIKFLELLNNNMISSLIVVISFENYFVAILFDCLYTVIQYTS